MSAQTVETARPVRTHPGFWFGVVATMLMLVGASAPSPFYPVLQEELGFSSAVMTVIFAIYAVFLLGALLVSGSLSDHVGRRPVVSAGFVVLAASMVAFWHADSVAMLLTARAVQGAATGIIMSGLAALVVDLEPRHQPGAASTFNAVFPLVGLALGALASGLVIEVVATPLPWVFGVLAVVFVAIAGLVWLVPETITRRAGAVRSLVPSVGVPSPARAAFWRGAPAVLAGWATGGLYLSLGAPLVGRELGAANHVLQGLVVTVLTGAGALTVFVMRHRSARTVMLFGSAVLGVGTLLTLLALSAHGLVAFLVAAAVTGTGFGTVFYGFIRSVTPTVGAHQRGELFGAVFTLSYLAFGLPAVAAGLASPALGLVTTTWIYGVAVAALSMSSYVLRRWTTAD